jgi:hypothetical protein
MLERVVPIEQGLRVHNRPLRGVLQLEIVFAEREPGAKLFAHGCGRAGSAVLDDLVGNLLEGFVLLQQALEPGVLVAALAREVLLGVVQLVLVEIELRLCEIQGITGVLG